MTPPPADPTTGERRADWKTLARELHVEWCLEGEDDGSEPDWQAAESCHAFAWSVVESDWLARRVRSAAEEGERRGGVKALREAAADPVVKHWGAGPRLRYLARDLEMGVAALASGRGALGEDSEGADGWFDDGGYGSDSDSPVGKAGGAGDE